MVGACGKQAGQIERLQRSTSLSPSTFEDPCSKLQGIFDRKEVCHFQIRSLTPQQAAGNALAFAVQGSPGYADKPFKEALWKTPFH
jgi:hypothetical protein